jgi:hypothetical protein
MRCTGPSRCARMATAFYRLPRFDVEVRGGIGTTVRRTIIVLCRMWIYSEHEKTKVMVFNFVDPCQEFVFEGDIIVCVQTFKYLGILLKTTPNLNRGVEYLPAASRHSLFVLNRRCVKLSIMDIKLRGDLFNTLVRSTTSYACEVWVDSKKMKAIEITKGSSSPCPRCEKQPTRPSCWQNLANSPLNTLHGDTRCCTIIM